MILKKRKFFRFILQTLVLLVLFLSACHLFQRFSSSQKSDLSYAQEQQPVTYGIIGGSPAKQPVVKKEKIPLVNDDNPASYQPDLVKIEGSHQIDRAAYQPLKQLLQDARDQGLDLEINSAYRSEQQQSTLHQKKINQLRRQGYSQQQARAEAKRIVARPGHSEHHLGLAVDFGSGTPADLQWEFCQTPEGRWLEANCTDYGFILRYPENKTHLTNIIYEPWHFRYVGKAAAQEMKTQNLCLEEYLDRE